MEIKKIYLAFVFTIIIFSIGFASAQVSHSISEVTSLVSSCQSGQFVSGIASNGISCAIPSGGSSQWNNDGVDIYYNAGKVGIGTSTTQRASSLLHFRGAVPAIRLEDSDTTNDDTWRINGDNSLLAFGFASGGGKPPPHFRTS